MRVTEENFEKVAKIIGYLSEFLIKIRGTTGASYIKIEDRITMAQVGLDALEHYYKDLADVCGNPDPDSEDGAVGF